MATLMELIEEEARAKGDLLSQAEKAQAVKRGANLNRISGGYLVPDGWGHGGELFRDAELCGNLRVRGGRADYKIDRIEVTGRSIQTCPSGGFGIRVKVHFADEGHVRGSVAGAWLC